MKPPKVVYWDMLLNYYMNYMTFLLGNQHWDDFGLSKIGRYFKTAWRKRCLTPCDGFGVHPSFRQNMFLAVGSQTWTMSTKNS